MWMVVNNAAYTQYWVVYIALPQALLPLNCAPRDNNATRNIDKERRKPWFSLSYLSQVYGRGTWHMPRKNKWRWNAHHFTQSRLNFDISLSLLDCLEKFPSTHFAHPFCPLLPIPLFRAFTMECPRHVAVRCVGVAAFNLFLPQNDLWQCIEKF